MLNREEYKEANGIFRWVGGKMLIVIIIGTILGYVTFFTDTIIKRKVFENSFQYSEARKTEIATFQAQLVEIESRLSGTLSEEMRANLEAQAAVIRSQLRVAKEKAQ